MKIGKNMKKNILILSINFWNKMTSKNWLASQKQRFYDICMDQDSTTSKPLRIVYLLFNGGNQHCQSNLRQLMTLLLDLAIFLVLAEIEITGQSCVSDQWLVITIQTWKILQTKILSGQLFGCFSILESICVCLARLRISLLYLILRVPSLGSCQSKV